MLSLQTTVFQLSLPNFINKSKHPVIINRYVRDMYTTMTMYVTWFYSQNLPKKYEFFHPCKARSEYKQRNLVKSIWHNWL